MASEQALIQQGNKLLNLYLAIHKDKYGATPKINRFKEKYSMKDVVESVGYERAEQLMKYYFKTSRTSHPLDWFKYNFEKLDAILDELAEDEVKKTKARQETAERVREWKVKNESRSAANQRSVQE